MKKKKQNNYLGGRWCRKHLSARWGKMRNGEWFPQCAQGFMRKEPCEIGD